MVRSATITETVTAPSVAPGSITIATSSATITTGQSATFSGLYLDTNGIGIVGATLYIFTNGVQKGTATTGPGGAYSFTLAFDAAGTYSVDVADNPGNT